MSNESSADIGLPFAAVMSVALIDDDAALPLPSGLRIYFERRRDVLIMELRELDRVLGRAQTVPVRHRGRVDMTQPND